MPFSPIEGIPLPLSGKGVPNRRANRPNGTISHAWRKLVEATLMEEQSHKEKKSYLIVDSTARGIRTMGNGVAFSNVDVLSLVC